MIFKRFAILFFCCVSNSAKEEEHLFTKFHQNDYCVKDLRILGINFNKEFIEDMTFVYSKFNRTTKVGNISILTRVDITETNTIAFMQVHKRYGNEFKSFGLSFPFFLCKVFEENILGLGVQTCGKISCPIEKNVRQTICNWLPDYSRLPPLIPDGQYMLKYNTSYKNQFLYNFDFSVVVYREVKKPQ